MNTASKQADTREFLRWRSNHFLSQKKEVRSMLPSKSTAVAETVSEFVENALNQSGTEEVDIHAVRTMVSEVTRLYAACCQSTGIELPALNETVSTTDALMLACALLRAHDLNPFDLALWFQRNEVNPSRAHEPYDQTQTGERSWKA
jgi:hypothetical protein